MTDNKHCVTSGDAKWNGPTNANLKDKLMDKFTERLVDFLTSVNEDNTQGNGWVTVNSLLTAPNVA
eukprot:15875418-Heterocapsa_arctica.AAC.1